MNEQEFAKIIITLETNFRSLNVLSNDQLREFWFKLIQDMEFGPAQQAALETCRHEEYPPKPATLRKYYNQLTQHSLGTIEDEIKKGLGRFGRYRYLEFVESLSERSRQVVKAIGFSKLVDTPVDKLDQVIKKNFEKTDSTKQILMIAGGRGHSKTALTDRLKQEGLNIGSV